MAASVNKVILVGNLGKDPDVRTTSMGTKIVNLNLATTESWKDKQSGEWKNATEWHRIVVFNERLADVAEKYLRKGRKIFVEGVLKTRQYKDSQGVDKYVTEVVLDRFRGELVLLDPQNSGEAQPQQSQTMTQYQAKLVKTSDAPKQQGNWDGGPSTPTDLDDEIPF